MNAPNASPTRDDHAATFPPAAAPRLLKGLRRYDPPSPWAPQARSGIVAAGTTRSGGARRGPTHTREGRGARVGPHAEINARARTSGHVRSHPRAEIRAHGGADALRNGDIRVGAYRCDRRLTRSRADAFVRGFGNCGLYGLYS